MPGLGFCTHLQMRRINHRNFRRKIFQKANFTARQINRLESPLLLTANRCIIVSMGCLVSGIAVLITGGLVGVPLLIMIGGNILIGSAVQSGRYLLMTKGQAFTIHTEKNYIISLAMGGFFGGVAPLIGLLNPGSHLLGVHAIKILGQDIGIIATEFCTISLTALIKTGVVSCLFVLFTKVAGRDIDYVDTIGGFISGTIGSNIATYLSFICPQFAALIYALICSTSPHFQYLLPLFFPDNFRKIGIRTSNDFVIQQVEDSNVITVARSQRMTQYWDYLQLKTDHHSETVEQLRSRKLIAVA